MAVNAILSAMRAHTKSIHFGLEPASRKPQKIETEIVIKRLIHRDQSSHLKKKSATQF